MAENEKDFAQMVRECARNEVMQILNRLFFSATIIADEKKISYAKALKEAHAKIIESYLKEPE